MVTGMMELPRETLDWFEGDELRARVFFEKYALQDIDGTPLELTPEEMWERIAKVLSELEETEEKRQEWYEKFRWLLSNFRFIPGGRIMHAVGNPRKVTPFNCFVLPIKDDSLEAIFECAKEMARTYSQGGGVGIDISVLRPAGSPVRNAARTSTGAVSFMELYSMVTGTIGQHGRRGALMITIADNHPDVLAFIDIKNDPERRRVRYANISVRVSDELMEAVQRNGKFELRFDGEYFSIRRTVDAREIWDKLIQNAWAAAEPGCLFWSTIKRYSTSEYNGMEVISTNPCVTGDTLVSTDEGLIPIAELAKRNRLPHAILDSRVSPHFYTGAIIKAWWSGRKPVYRVVTRAGYELRATADHKILTANRGWVQVKDLQPGDLLLIQNRKGGFGRYGDEHLGRILGWLVADGHVNHRDNRAVLDFYAQDRELAPVFAQSVAAVIPTSQRYPAPSAVAVLGQERVQIRSHRLLEKLVELGFDPAEKHKIPTVVWQGSEAMVKGFLQALFTADGTVQSSLGSRFSVHLTSTNLRFLKDVQILLAHFGIASRIYENRRPEGAKLMPDGRGGVKLYGTQPVHELVIGKDNIVRFYREIGFLPDSSKQKKLEQIVATYARSPYRETFTTPVVDVVPEGIEDVYDLTEAVSHTFIANGLTVANCGEEPLPAYGNCNLGNINLSAFVLDEFTDAARVDWESLEKAVRYAVRFLDNVITYAVKEDRLPLPQQKERCAAERRIGVGFTGLGDMLAQLRLKYDTDDALEFVDELFHKIKCWAYDESVNLAIERGPFPLFDPEKHLQMGFIRERLPRELQEKIRRHGIRNVCVLTVPPVGSGAAMAGVTSGIEPIFALSYIRRSESLSKGEFKVFHPSVRRYMQKFGIDDERELPEFFVTAHQIAPEMRVRMQAIIQSHIDQSISSCLTRNNLILTDKGLRYIDTICPERREGEFVPLRGWKVANENGLVTASDFYFNGIRPIYRVILEGGYTLEGTGNHRVLTVTSDHELVWRRLDELQEGEFVVLRKGLEVWGNLRQLSEIYGRPFVADRQTNAHPIRIPHRVTKLLARFLGYLLSDGGVLSNGNTVAFTQQKGEVLEHFCHLAEQLFGIKPKLHRDLRGHNLYNAKIHSRTLVRFLEYLGAAHQGAEKRTPLCILSAGREIVKEFIRGLTLDGYVSRFADGNPRITVLCNLSERLVREVQQLLLNFGIESNIIAKPYEISDFRHLHGRIYRHERRVLYDLYVTAENAHRFMELIGFAEQRKNEEAWQLLRKTRLMRAPLGGVVPVNGQVVGTLREAMKRVRSFRLYEQIHSLTQHMRTRKVVERDNLLYALEAMQTVATVPPFILDPTYTFKRVKLVVQLPEPQETFDLSVPDGHHYIANGIVSHNTVNLPHDITTQEVERIYFLAWKLGCKGITVYREGSREGVLITEEFAQQKRGRLMPKPRPMVMVGKTYKLRTEMGNVYVTVNADEEGPQEVFVRLGKSGSSAMAFTEAIGRLISLALRAGVSPEAIIDQLSGIKSSSATRQENGTIIFSVPDAVAKALEMFLKGENPPKSSALTEVLLQALSESNETELAVPPIPSIREELPQILQANGARYSGDLCPNCGEPLIHSGGCELCLFCGYSRCQ
jgi:ribonucleoside-diphosphate reductase alpha chain